MQAAVLRNAVAGAVYSDDECIHNRQVAQFIERQSYFTFNTAVRRQAVVDKDCAECVAAVGVQEYRDRVGGVEDVVAEVAVGKL